MSHTSLRKEFYLAANVLIRRLPRFVEHQLYFGSTCLFENELDVESVFRKIVSWSLGGTGAGSPIPADADMDPTLKSFLELCLQPKLSDRPVPGSLLNHPFLADAHEPSSRIWHVRPYLLSATHTASSQNGPSDPTRQQQTSLRNTTPGNDFTLSQLFYLWRLNGGDIELELLKQGISAAPSIERIPRLVRITDDVDDMLASSDALHLYSDQTVVVPLDALWQKLRASLDGAEGGGGSGDSRREEWKQVLPWTAQNLAKDIAACEGGTPRLGLLGKEKDVGYQAARIQLFTTLLREYPASREDILKEAAVDIPPMLRGKLWAAILEIKGDPDLFYESIDKETESPHDRQLDLDIPRCHQYNELLSSHVGHAKLKRILKAWQTAEEDRLVYWQGLDSVCAPFLSLNFNDEALGFCSLRAFLKKYSASFFVADNSVVLQEHMVAFRHILAFHDPELAVHMQEIGLGPELFALPWFMTLYAHIFPLDKIYHLWDSFLTGPPFLHLHAGVAILQQLRDQLIHRDFNTAMMLFSELSGVDVDACIAEAIVSCKLTPPSMLDTLYFANAGVENKDPDAVPIEKRKQMQSPPMAIKIAGQRSKFVVVLGDNRDVASRFASTVVTAKLRRTCVLLCDVDDLESVEPFLCECVPTQSATGVAKCNNM
ncbi:hypothetical protein HK104_008324 [Borealophlyctis nickersoniae]|nr:hypothetical protein HK104_008324 [Borealophlyctis nickersoniae]